MEKRKSLDLIVKLSLRVNGSFMGGYMLPSERHNAIAILKGAAKYIMGLEESKEEES
jgi:hypothetical protein